MKLTSFAFCALIALSFSSCQSNNTSSDTSPYAQTGADPGNPYGTYPQAPAGGAYPNEGDYVDVAPVQPQPDYSYQPPSETYQPPAYGSQPTYEAPAAPAPYGDQTYAANTSAGSYTVVRGDTLYSISRRNGTSVDAIKRANGLSSDSIYPGDVLAIP